MYRKNTLTKWPDQGTELNVEMGAMKGPTRVGNSFNATILPTAAART